MNPEERITARRQLDKRLSTLQGAGNLARPPRGWIRAIREASLLSAWASANPAPLLSKKQKYQDRSHWIRWNGLHRR
jgi:hypothetical protein